MKISLLLFFISCGFVSISQDLITNVTSYQAAKLTIKGSSYNDFLNKTYSAPSGTKFVVVEGVIKDNESDKKIEDSEIKFESNDRTYLPVGHFDRGELKFTKPRDLTYKYAKGFSYVFCVDLSVSKGELKLGAEPSIVVSAISKTAPVVAKPRLMKVLSSSITDKFTAKDDAETELGAKAFFDIEYTPYSGKFLKVELNVLAPEKPNAGKNENYNFNPGHFHLTSKDGSIYKCAAFIRDGNYEGQFSESMNSNVRYLETEPKKLVLVFFFGESKGDFTLFHKDVESGTITVK